MYGDLRVLPVLPHSFPTRRSSDLPKATRQSRVGANRSGLLRYARNDAISFASAVNSSADTPSGTPRKSRPGTAPGRRRPRPYRSEEHTSELQSLMRISYAVFCLKKKQETRQT